MLINPRKKIFQFGSQEMVLETGAIARQATSAVLVNLEGTSVLVAVVAHKEANEGSDFFPLTVHYQERSYAAGRIPGGYFKREGRPTEKEILTSRLIDRPIRPLFPEGFYNEVQIVVTVLSSNPDINPDIPAMIGASAALALSGLPFKGPIGAVRVGYSQGSYLLNPTFKQLETSDLDLVVAGTENAVLMVESQAAELSEEVMLGAVLFGHQQMQVAIQAIKEFVQEAGKPAWDWQPVALALDEATTQEMTQAIETSIAEAYQIVEKTARKAQLDRLREETIEKCSDEEKEISAASIQRLFSSLEEKIVRQRILEGVARIDGRDKKTVRPITIQPGLLPRTHGSALFTRGETQVLAVVTLGTDRDAQIIEALDGEARETFMLHYNFPPYSVGETGQMGSPKRREIGHGSLAKRALRAVLPSESDFPYVLRTTAEVLESNGSSSMATVCGASIALMDAGVPLKKHVAGIAMGLVKEGQRFIVLTDILGDEDHLGDMDFKVAGTIDGITALQMDIKIDGITEEILKIALEQAKEGRLHILAIMREALETPRLDVSPYAPRITTLKINPEKIRDLIGKGGATIRSITEETGTLIDISDDGLVRISTSDFQACQEALERIKKVTAEVEVGCIYEGPVVKLTDFGAFVNILPGRDGLVHISQISNERVENITDVLSEGQLVNVKVLEIDRQGRIRLTMKDLETKKETESEIHS